MKIMKVILLVVVIFLSSGVFAISGVNPRAYEVDFVPNYEGEFSFNFVIDGNSKVDLYVDGDLAEYVSLNKERVSGSENVVASLHLPPEVDSPGINEIQVVVGDVVGVIKVNVPYPEKYVELELSAPNANVGDVVDISLEVFSRGSEGVVVGSKVEIYKIEDWEFVSEGLGIRETNELIEILEADEDVSINMSEIFKWSIDSSNYSMGSYLVVAVVDYSEGIVEIENSFKVGGSLVRILNYTKEFRKNKIDKFEIEVESLGDDDIGELYAEINIVGLEETKFVTSSIGLGKWRTAMLSGFLDSSEILEDEIEAEIILYYDGKTTSQVVKLKILKGSDYVSYVVVFVGLAVVGLLVWRGSKFIRRYRELRITEKK